MKINKLLIVMISILTLNCGGGSSSSSSSSEDDNANENVSEQILTQKLVGTPFEGETIGDDFQDCFFIKGDYFTGIVEEADLPIELFAAFFTESEEELIQEGIDIVNESLNLDEDLFVLVDDFNNKVRPIIKVDTFYDSQGGERNIRGHTDTFGYNENRQLTEGNYFTDFEIFIGDVVTQEDLKFVVVHEMGHALGIVGHEKYIYDGNGTTEVLEENSVMEFDLGTELNDYNFMMEKQSEILMRNLGNSDDSFLGRNGSCPSPEN